MFTLYALESQQRVERARFENGQLAARAARLLTIISGNKYQPRKITDSNWQEREKARFESGEYTPVLDRINSYLPAEHFAHVAKKRPDAIAYTMSDDKGRSDIQSVLSVKAYLDKYFPWAEIYAEDDKDYHLQRLTEMQIKDAFVKLSPIHFIEPGDDEATADKWEEVYRNFDSSAAGVNCSCMRHDVEEYRTEGVHPVRAYAAGDLGLAYMVNPEGETVSRSIIWPEIGRAHV